MTVVAPLNRLRVELDLSHVFVGQDPSLMRNFRNRGAVVLRGKVVESGDAGPIVKVRQHPEIGAPLSATPAITPGEEAQKPKVTKDERAPYAGRLDRNGGSVNVPDWR